MDERVCPFCGEPPGAGVFCAACGRNLAAVEQLPTRAEWQAAQPADAAPADERPLADRCAAATAAFLAAMHATGDPGTTEIAITGRSGFFRTPKVRGWIVRPVHRDEDAQLEDLRHYDPGLVLTTDGVFHRLDSEVRGWGQRDFPKFHDSIDPEPIELPIDERLVEELATLQRDAGVA